MGPCCATTYHCHHYISIIDRKVALSTSFLHNSHFIMPGVTHEGLPKNYFEILVQSLTEKLGPCSGIDSDDVDARELQDLMEQYVSDESEWDKYFFPASNMSYTRNLVDKGNGKCNLVGVVRIRENSSDLAQLILVWSPGKGSPIHE